MANKEDGGVTPCSPLEVFKDAEISGSNDFLLYMREFEFFQDVLEITSVLVCGAAIGGARFITHGDDLECLVL
jgi:hypothetical protein